MINCPGDNAFSAAAALTVRTMTIYPTCTHLTPEWKEATEIKHLPQGHSVMTPGGSQIRSPWI